MHNSKQQLKRFQEEKCKTTRTQVEKLMMKVIPFRYFNTDEIVLLRLWGQVSLKLDLIVLLWGKYTACWINKQVFPSNNIIPVAWTQVEIAQIAICYYGAVKAYIISDI